jgi:hypothetical protein
MKKTRSKKSRDTVPLKGDLSNDSTSNPPFFSLVNTFNYVFLLQQIANPQKYELYKFVRFADLLQMWQFADLLFEYPFFVICRFARCNITTPYFIFLQT